MAQLFGGILITSAVGGILYLILQAITPLRQRYLSPTVNYYVWLAVLLVLLIPFRISVGPPAFTPSESTQTPQNESTAAPTPDVHPSGAENPHAPSDVIQSDESDGNVSSPIHKITEYLRGVTDIIPYLWFSVFALLFSFRLFKYVIFSRRLRAYSRESRAVDMLSYTGKAVSVRESPLVGSPFVMGTVKPTLYLPEGGLSAEELHATALHESCHITRRDTLYKWIVVFAKCVHWFNPLVYSLSRRIDEDCEISCDHSVSRGMDNETRRRYMNSVLTVIAKSSSQNAPCGTGMSGEGDILRKRFTMIKSNKIFTKKLCAVMLSVIAVLLLGAFIGGGILNGSFFASAEDSESFNVLLAGIDEQGGLSTVFLAEVNGDSINVRFIPAHTHHVSPDALNGVYSADAEETTVIAIEHSTTLKNVYYLGGMDSLVKEAEKILDTRVNYRAEVSITVIGEIVDALGGVEFNVPCDMVYTPLDIDLRKGEKVLSGKEACDLLRFRSSYVQWDVERISVQQDFMKAFFEQKLLGADTDDLVKVLKSVWGNIKTDYPIEKLSADIMLIKNISRGSVTFETVEN